MERTELQNRIHKARVEAPPQSEAETQMAQDALDIRNFISGTIGLPEFLAGMNNRVRLGLVQVDDLQGLKEVMGELFPFGADSLVNHEAEHVRAAAKHGLGSSNGILLARNEFGTSFYMALTFVKLTEDMDEDLARRALREIASAPTDLSWSDKLSLD